MKNNLLKFIKSIIKPAMALINLVGHSYVSLLCRIEYRRQSLNRNERPLEFEFVFRKISERWPSNLCDVGTGLTALPHLIRNCGILVTSIDNIVDYWGFGYVNRHYHVLHDDIKNSKLSAGKFDMVVCVSVIEHIKEHALAMQGMVRLLRPGGSLILTCPYNENKYSENVYKLKGSDARQDYPFVTQAFSRHQISEWLSLCNMELVDQEYWRFYDGEYWTCGSILPKPIKVTANELHQISCIEFRKLD
jgi:2-polyprenyl-3-methyl-5-hydroxy-6-metoxy-1,4-benzoquinol methylase